MSLVSFLLALGTKEIAATFPIAVLMVELLLMNLGRNRRKLMVAGILTLGVGLLATILYADLLRRSVGSDVQQAGPGTRVPVHYLGASADRGEGGDLVPSA